MTSSSFLRRRQSQWSITMWASKRSARSTKCMREHLRRQELHQMHKVLETGSLESSGKFALLLTRRKCSSSGWNAFMGKEMQFGYKTCFYRSSANPRWYTCPRASIKKAGWSAIVRERLPRAQRSHSRQLLSSVSFLYYEMLWDCCAPIKGILVDFNRVR